MTIIGTTFAALSSRSNKRKWEKKFNFHFHQSDEERDDSRKKKGNENGLKENP